MDQDLHLDCDPFNSSDIEFEPPPDRYSHVGSMSIEAMLENRFNDRLNSKKASRQLVQSVNSPYHQRMIAMVWRRFETFYVHTLQKRSAFFSHPWLPVSVLLNILTISNSIDTTPTGSDLERFLTTIAQYIKPVAHTVPRLSTMWNQLQTLVDGLIFRYPILHSPPMTAPDCQVH